MLILVDKLKRTGRKMFELLLCSQLDFKCKKFRWNLFLQKKKLRLSLEHEFFFLSCCCFFFVKYKLMYVKFLYDCYETFEFLRLSSTWNPYGHLNPKWIARDLKSASNRVPIRETYFGLPERHNPNMSILCHGNLFVEMILFWVLLLEKMPNMYWTFCL